MVSVSDSVLNRFFSESRIQYRIPLDMGMIPDSDSSTQKLVSPTSEYHGGTVIRKNSCLKVFKKVDVKEFWRYLTVEKVGRSHERRDIYLVSIGRGEKGKNAVWIDAG